MEDRLHIKETKGPSLNPWFLILITAIAPLFLFLLIFYRWYNDRVDYKRTTNYFIQRQNTVMAYDAMEVAVGFGDLLEKAARDIRLLELMSQSSEGLTRFYKTQMGDYTRFTGDNTGISEPLPFYNRIEILNANGDANLLLMDGKVTQGGRTLAQCQIKNLCDHTLLEHAVKLKPGELYYGTILRYYTTEGQPEIDTGGGLSVAYRGAKSIYVLGIDYRHLKDHLSMPTFPYDSKKNLLEAYQKGNYIFIVDSNNNIVTHPHYWKAAGIDPKSGEWAKPMKTDADSGKHPINIAFYEKGVLFDYFQRLINVSFKQKGVDIFRAANLIGTIRILSVAPIFISKGQFTDAAPFGHVITACNVDYFEEPKEMIVPYY